AAGQRVSGPSPRGSRTPAPTVLPRRPCRQGFRCALRTTGRRISAPAVGSPAAQCSSPPSTRRRWVRVPAPPAPRRSCRDPPGPRHRPARVRYNLLQDVPPFGRARVRLTATIGCPPALRPQLRKHRALSLTSPGAVLAHVRNAREAFSVFRRLRQSLHVVPVDRSEE